MPSLLGRTLQPLRNKAIGMEVVLSTHDLITGLQSLSSKKSDIHISVFLEFQQAWPDRLLHNLKGHRVSKTKLMLPCYYKRYLLLLELISNKYLIRYS